MTDQTTNPDPASDRPLVTFALFAYNQEQYIREAVEGAFSQTYEPLEIILSDDCSSDRTFEIMQEMAAAYEGPHEVSIRRNEANLGLAGHINVLLNSVSGEYVSWSAGDDIALGNKIEELIKPALLDDKVVGVHSPYIKIDKLGNVLPTRSHRPEKETISLKKVIDECASVVSQSHLFKTSVFHQFGVFRTDLENEGPPITFRELFCGKVVYVKIPLIKYRIGSGVSTYRGNDISELKSNEPLKVIRWRLSAYRQILDDMVRTNLPKSAKYKVAKEIIFYQNLFNINNKQMIVRSLMQNIRYKPNNLLTIRALVRTLIPETCYKLYIELSFHFKGK